jgi:hypothetical protein
MGDLTVTAAQVAAVFPEKAEIYSGIAGVTITAVQAVYIIASSGKLGLADENASAEASAVIGIALNGGGAGQAIDVLRRGHVYGFTLTSEDYGEMVSLSATAGALLDTGATTSVVGRVEALADADLTKVLYVDCSLGVLSAFA